MTGQESKLQKIMDMCKCEVSVTVNQYLSNYRTVDEELEVLRMADYLDISLDVEKKIIETGIMIDVTAYPRTPIGHHCVIHYDLDMALDLMIDLLEDDN